MFINKKNLANLKDLLNLDLVISLPQKHYFANHYQEYN